MKYDRIKLEVGTYNNNIIITTMYMNGSAVAKAKTNFGRKIHIITINSSYWRIHGV